MKPMPPSPVNLANPVTKLDATAMPVQACVDLGRALGQPIRNPLPGGEPFLVIPNGYTVADISAHAPPTHIRTHVALTEPAAFIAYVNRFKTDRTLIFASVTDSGAKLNAVLDYHGPPSVATDCHQADRLAHKATFECIPTNEWRQWVEANGKRFDQVGFATWLEEHQDLIVTPTGAELLEFVQTLEGKNSVRFNSAIRLASGGNALAYDEDVELQGSARTESGKMVLPSVIEAGIRPFQGLDKYKIRARLKYRIESRKLSLWFETIAMHRSVRDAAAGVLKDVAEKTGIVPLAGAIN